MTTNIPGNYYNKHQSNNILVKYLMKKFHEKLFFLIKKTKSESLLDVGCGEGYTTRLIKRKFPELIINGSELESEPLEKAGINNPDIKFNQESIYNLKRKDASFDLVMASEVLEHLEEPHKAIEECKRVSKNYCIFTVPYEPWWRVANVIRLAYLSEWGNTPGHIQHWNKIKFRKMLNKHFRTVKIHNSLLWNLAICRK